MHLIMWLAIYTGRRQDELCHLLLSDFDRANNQWLVRDVKNPNGTIGNHKYAHLEPNALLLIDECLDVTTRNRMSILGYDQNLLIPMNAQTISSYFARGCKICEIDGLRFHDLRHECATRYAEDGFSIPQLQTITLHSSWASLQRYVNLKKRSDRLDYVDAIANAKKLHSEHNITTKTVKRHINRVDIAHAKKAIEIAKNPTMLQANWDFIQPFLDSFVKDFHPSKRIVDDFTLHLGVDNVFLWDNARQRFTLDYTQDAWEKYLFKHFTIDDLPDGATHFDCRTLDVLRIDDYHVYKYVQGVWADITAYYTLHKERLIELF